jgi:large-conductance mechanosensitive channel
MKNNFAFVVLILILSLSFFSGCKKEYKTKTVINEDGSCERTVKLISDNKVVDFKYIRFPVPNKEKSGWDIKSEKETNDSNKYVYTAYKKFAQVDDLNKEYSDKEKFGVEVNLYKKFSWFYTYMEYKETYKKYFPFNNIALKEYLSADEYQKYKNGDTTKVMKNKIDEFMGKNLLAEFWKILKDSMKVKSIGNISYDFVFSKKEEVENFLKIDIERSKTNELSISSLGKILQIKDVKPFYKLISSIADGLKQKFVDAIVDDDEYSNKVIMPGIIISSNATSIKGNEAEWKLDQERFCFDDYVMTVESRVTNVWAFVITAVVVFILLILLIIPRFKKPLLS